MNSKDIVRLSIYSKTSSSLCIITSRENANQFKETATNYSSIWVEIKGKLDHVNANNTEVTILNENISGFDITEVNQI